MTDICQKPSHHDQCCCNCVNRVVIDKHPWNVGAGRGGFGDFMGYGCVAPGFIDANKRQIVTFMDGLHGMCEMHEFRDAQILTGAKREAT